MSVHIKMLTGFVAIALLMLQPSTVIVGDRPIAVKVMAGGETWKTNKKVWTDSGPTFVVDYKGAISLNLKAEPAAHLMARRGKDDKWAAGGKEGVLDLAPGKYEIWIGTKDRGKQAVEITLTP